MIRPTALVLLIAALSLGSLPARAQGEAADAARAAAARLEQATLQLDAAQSARDRVRALTETVAAFDFLKGMADSGCFSDGMIGSGIDNWGGYFKDTIASIL